MNGIDFTGAWAQLAIAEHAVLEISRQPSSYFTAEICEGLEADYYLVRTNPGDELRAMRWLPRRGFGTFQPMQRRRNVYGAPLSTGALEPLFPCWVFVRLWPSKANFEKLERTPGVAGVLADRSSGRPVAVDWQFLGGKRISFVDRLRGIHETECAKAASAGNASAMQPGHAAVRGKRQAQRLEPRQRKLLQRLNEAARSREIFTASQWANLTQLAPHERITLLQEALAGPSQAKLSSGSGG